jgi:uncharacterized protein (TIGR00730 family)
MNPPKLKALCVYCGSAAGADPAFAAAAAQTGNLLAERGITLVYGGGSGGLMGVVANGALAAGGRVVGIIPEKLMQREVGHRGLTELHVVPDMHVRKRMMAELADGFLALPGGLGTFEELFEVWTWRQLGYHSKPIGLLNAQGYYDSLLSFLRHGAASGFVQAAQLNVLHVDTQAAPLLDTLQAHAVASASDLSTI